MPTDPLTGSRYPAASAAPNVAQDLQNAVLDLADNTIPRFATTSARDSAYTSYGTLSNGMSCWCDSPGAYFDRINGAWVQRNAYTGVLKYVEYSDVNPNNLSTPDTTLTVYSLPTFTVPANRRLRMVHTVTLDSSTSPSTYIFRYRLGGTVIRQSWMSMTAAAVPETRTFSHVIMPSAGSLTLTISGERMAGTGTPRLLVDSANGPTSFYVEDIGSSI